MNKTVRKVVFTTFISMAAVTAMAKSNATSIAAFTKDKNMTEFSAASKDSIKKYNSLLEQGKKNYDMLQFDKAEKCFIDAASYNPKAFEPSFWLVDINEIKCLVEGRYNPFSTLSCLSRAINAYEKSDPIKYPAIYLEYDTHVKIRRMYVQRAVIHSSDASFENYAKAIKDIDKLISLGVSSITELGLSPHLFGNFDTLSNTNCLYDLHLYRTECCLRLSSKTNNLQPLLSAIQDVEKLDGEKGLLQKLYLAAARFSAKEKDSALLGWVEKAIALENAGEYLFQEVADTARYLRAQYHFSQGKFEMALVDLDTLTNISRGTWRGGAEFLKMETLLSLGRDEEAYNFAWKRVRLANLLKPSQYDRLYEIAKDATKGGYYLDATMILHTLLKDNDWAVKHPEAKKIYTEVDRAAGGAGIKVNITW